MKGDNLLNRASQRPEQGGEGGKGEPDGVQGNGEGSSRRERVFENEGTLSRSNPRSVVPEGLRPIDRDEPSDGLATST